MGCGTVCELGPNGLFVKKSKKKIQLESEEDKTD
jgi:hypothetical protein